MRIVSAAEAVASVRSGDQVYVHCAAAAPSVLLDALVARAPELRDVGIVHLHIEGPGSAPRPGDGRPLPPPRPVHRSERPRGRQRGPGRLRAGLPLRRPAPLRLRLDPAGRRPGQRHPARRPRLLLAGRQRRGDARGDPRRDDGHRAAQPVDAADPGRELHPRGRHRPRRRGRPASVRAPRPARSARWSAASASTSPSSSPTARRSSWVSVRSRRPRPWPSTASATWGSTPRCSRTPSSTWSRPGSSTGVRKDRNRGKIVTAFLMGTQRLYDFVDDNPMVEMRSVDFTNDTARHPLVPADDRDQLGHRGGPDRPGRGRLDRASPVLGRNRPSTGDARCRPRAWRSGPPRWPS